MAPLKLKRRHLLVSAPALWATAGVAKAATFERPVRWIVGYPPGGATDALARLLAPSLSSRINQTIIVDNRPGAGSAIGATVLANAAPDGYTLMGADNGTLVINPVIYTDLKYDPDRDFRPVGLYAGINLLLAVRNDSPIRSGADFLEQAKAARDPTAYGSPGVGSPLHLAMERLARDAKIRLSHVPYRGMAPALVDVLGGSVPSVIIDYTTAAQVIKSGQLRALAVFSETRLPALPDVPTMAEQGVAGFSAGAWQGLIAPRKTPDDVVRTLSVALGQAMSEPNVKRRYEELGLDMPPSDPETFAKRWQSDRAIWQPLIRELDIRLNG